MKKYSLDNACTGDFKADDINSRIMEVVDDMAEELALRDWGENRKGFWIEASDGEGETMCEEARQIWEEHYDKYVDILYNFANRVIEIDAPTPKEKEIERLGHYVVGGEAEESYDILIKAHADGHIDSMADDFISMWTAMEDFYTVNELLNIIQD